MLATDPRRQPTIVYIPTADGGRVAVKRRVNRGGPPAVFLHGIGVNADLWNLPHVEGADFRYQSLASLLHGRGFDVWLANLRGHGAPHMFSAPPPRQRDWCLDHFVLFDLPAVVQHVIEHTGQAPFIVGASMGAMALAGYLQGARLASATPPRIAADHELARERQNRLGGAIFVEFPARLRWPESLYDSRGRLRWSLLARAWRRGDSEVNFPFELLSRSAGLLWLVERLGHLPVDWLAHRRRDPLGADATAEEGPTPRRMERLERTVCQFLLNIAGTFTGATHHRAEVLLSGRWHVFDRIKSGVLRQLTRCVRAGAFVSDLGDPPHVYSDHYDRVELPTLVVQGGQDRIANAGVTREAFFERISARDKSFLYYEEIAHGELEAAPIASAKVYPHILAWLEARAGRTPRSWPAARAADVHRGPLVWTAANPKPR